MNDSPPTVKVLLFGKTGEGKSTLGNMLLTGGTTGVFNLTPGMEGGTNKCETKVRDGWTVTDTVGLFDETTSERRDAVTQIQGFLKKTRGDYDHVLFVKRAGRFDQLDEQVWKVFLNIFHDDRKGTQDRHHGIAVVFTDASDSWFQKNRDQVSKKFKEAGNRYIAVDFARHSDVSVEENVRADRRGRDLAKLQERLRGYRQAHGFTTFRPHYSDYTDRELARFAQTLLLSILRLAGTGALYCFLMVYQLPPPFSLVLSAFGADFVSRKILFHGAVNELFRALGWSRH